MSRSGPKLPTLLLALAGAALLAGCGGTTSDLDAYIADVKARPAQPIDPIPPVKTYTPYTYEGQTGRDPFMQSTSEGSDAGQTAGAGSGPRPDLDRPREFLEDFELDTLAMVGTFKFEEGGDDWALIQDPNGTVHRVAVGNYLGKNHGRIVQIRPTEVQLTEFITDGLGGWLVRDASMTLEGQ